MGENDTPKLVPETDLMAVKAQVAKWEEKYNTDTATLKQTADGHYTNLLAAQAAATTVAAELDALKKEAEGLRPLGAEKEKLTKRIGELESLLLDSTRQRVLLYGVPEDKLKGKTLAELSAIEEAIKLIGVDTKRFDLRGSGSGALSETSSAHEKMTHGWEQIHR